MQSYKTNRLGLCIGFFLAAAAGFAADLNRQYRATLDFTEQGKGYEWTTGPEHVWRLKEFAYALGDGFHIKLGPSQVVFGCHDSNVVWAAVLPDKPGEIVAAPEGTGEHVTSVWMRFHPSRVGELFPERIIARQGDAAALPRAKRLATHKLDGSWHIGNQVTIPAKKSINLDLETSEGPRRFYYSDDTDGGQIEYVDAFRTRPLAAPKPLNEKTALAAFDKVWNAFDREYAMFAIKPQVEWAKLRATYHPRAAAAEDNYTLGTVICQMLDHLEDLHVYVMVDGQYITGYNRARPLNANPNALPHLVEKIIETEHGLEWGRTGDAIGYISIDQLSDPRLPQTFDEVLGGMADIKGLVLDLRYNGGGSEPLGCQIAGRLLDRRRVYSLSQFRSGPKHSDLGERQERACGPEGPWHYAGPVVVLQGQKTMSSAESFALALAQCPQVTTMGDRTAGSSGNPVRVEAGAGIIVNLPRWIDMDPHGKAIDVVGIAPQVKVEAKPDDFSGERDPVLEAALENLRKRIRTEKPSASGVLQSRPGVPSPNVRPTVVWVSPSPGATEVDSATEVRIRFDRPMDPDTLAIGAHNPMEQRFCLRAPPRYRAETREFVIPIRLRPGVRYEFGFPLAPERPDADNFWSDDGVPAREYSWHFSTRAAAAATPAKGPPPRIVSADPPSGSRTGRVVTIRVRFDRPMDPQAHELVPSISREKDKDPPTGGIRIQFPVQYDAPRHCFTFHAFLQADVKAGIEFRDFRSADGGRPDPLAVEYQVGKELYAPQQEARIAEAGRSVKLREVVEAVRRKRLTISSLEETVRAMNDCDDFGDRSSWDGELHAVGARFGFQGDRRFYADLSRVMTNLGRGSFQAGSDGKECWFFHAVRNPDSGQEEKRVGFCPFDSVRDKEVTIADPFGAKRFPSAEKAIAALKLEYVGLGQCRGRSCHHVRSWAGSAFSQDYLRGFCDWLIDAQSLLPVVCNSDYRWYYFFTYDRINGPVAAEAFLPPAGADIQRKPYKLEEGYNRLYWAVSDGSNGKRTAEYGQSGPQGFTGFGL